MADLKVEGAELKKLVKLGKKRSLGFGFCPGAKNEHTLLIDRRKSPAMLGKLARQEGSSPKVAFGTFEVKGRTMEMTCERTVPQMAKVLKKYLKSQKTLVNVVILDADGNTLESDVEELPADPTMEDEAEATETPATATPPEPPVAEAAPQSAPAEPDPEDSAPAADPAALAARLKALQPAIAAAETATADKLKKVMAAAVGQIKSAALEQADQTITALEGAVAKLNAAATGSTQAAPPEPDLRALAARAKALQQAMADVAAPARDKLMTALSSAAQHIKDRNPDAADAMLDKIEAALNKVMAADAPAPAADGDAEKWKQAEARLQPAVDKAIQDKRGDLGAINMNFNAAKDYAAAGNFAGALHAAGKTAELLKQAASAQTTAAAQEAGDSVMEGLVPLRTAWIETRLGMRKDIEKLKAEIDRVTAAIEGMEDVPSKSGVLFDYLDEIDKNLEDTLNDLTQAQDPGSRNKLKSDARQIITSYKSVLDTDFFKAVDDNGFVQTNIRGAALASLDKVSAALAA
ncbi:hypothetical protein I5535_07525 [Rhodobacteraceae bacterium F11138]|nr:hypothetical protein [Rhodobacteraceae bacterium F11138]